MRFAPNAAELRYALAPGWDVEVWQPTATFQTDQWMPLTSHNTEESGRTSLARYQDVADIPECFRLIKVTREVVA